jgi:Lipocalin-like domain
MKRIATLAAGVALLTSSGFAAAAEDLASQIVGVWKFVSVINTEVATGKVTHPWGEKPIGYVVYTKGGRLIFTLVSDNRARPANPTAATDAERLRLYDTLASGSGTYKIDGNTQLSTFDSSWLETWTGTTQKRKIAITGNKLTVTSDPFKNPAGQEVTFENVYERVE